MFWERFEIMMLFPKCNASATFANSNVAEFVKFIATFILVAATVYIYVYNSRFLNALGHERCDETTSDTCRALLEHGYLHNNEWETCGCRMHRYSQRDTQVCFNRSYEARQQRQIYLLFVGDSTVRELFHEFVADIGCANFTLEKVHEAITRKCTQQHLLVDFIWGPTIPGHVWAIKSVLSRSEDQRPEILTAGANLWIADADLTSKRKDAMVKHQNDLQNLVRQYEGMGNRTRVVWMPQASIITEPHQSRDCYKVNSYNDIAFKVFKGSSVTVWHTSRHVTSHFIWRASEDGIHHRFSDRLVLRVNVQILLNLYCNRFMDTAETLCCGSW
jgi:hypothetical protein